ncbi:MAG: hypothetical protein IKW10_05095 [Oscillospiraceae bacterium]|nr:hypothetical protein [Oscillospiraceae bacterium]
MNTKEITVLMVEPGQHPKVTTLKDDLIKHACVTLDRKVTLVKFFERAKE